MAGEASCAEPDWFRDPENQRTSLVPSSTGRHLRFRFWPKAAAAAVARRLLEFSSRNRGAAERKEASVEKEREGEERAGKNEDRAAGS